MPHHPDPWIALAWIIALALVVVAAVATWMRLHYWKRFRFNAKFRAIDRGLSGGIETLKDRETKLPPIL